MLHTQATFAKLPTGELTVVLSLNYKSRSVTVGTRRLSTSTNTYKIIRMYVDSLIFSAGVIERKDREIQPYWYGTWHCEGDNWESFDKYYVTVENLGVKVAV